MKSINVFIFVLLLSPITESFAEFDGGYWIVRRGDTLYAIARAVYPGDARQQARLRKDIIKLNQNVFAAGGRSLFIGLKLHMPAYAAEAKNSAKQVVVKKPVVKKPVVNQAGKRALSKSSARLISNNQWQIKRGDTLYSIGRYFFPKSNRQQYKLRQEIVSLNPDVFGRGRGRLEIGMLLTLPDYLVKQKTRSKVVAPIKPSAKPQVISPKISQVQPQAKQIKTKPETRTNQQVPVKPRPDRTEQPRTVRRASVSDYDDYYSLSFGYSLGGDDALIVSGGRDITFGSGLHLRFNYDGFWNNKHGLRVALGYQSDGVTADNGSGDLEQVYLQTMYVYNFSSSLVGIGITYHDGIVFEAEVSSVKTSLEPDAAAGTILFYEYKRFYTDHIIGVSHSSLESEDALGDPLDMSRTEIYYRWQF